MKIGIIGATGMAGSNIYKEAVKRDHEVTAIVRDSEKAKELLGEHVQVITSDALDLSREDLEGFDVVVNAFGTAPDTAYLHVDLAAQLVKHFRKNEETRLFFILGAGSLFDQKEERFIETIRQTPGSENFIQIPEAQLKELNFLEGVENVDWVGVSPGAEFVVGEVSEYRLGQDHLLFDEDGKSETTYATMAQVILDEIENPTHTQERFTAINI